MACFAEWITKLRRLLNPETDSGPNASLFFSSLPRMETARLILRKVQMRDADDLYQYAKDPEVARHVLWSAHQSVSDTRAYIRYIRQQYQMGTPSSYAVVLKSSGRMIGTIGWMQYSAENRSAEVGYSIARDCWNQGYVTEALQAVLRLSFQTLELNRVYGFYETDNPASRRVMEKCGMAYEGTLRQSVWNKGRFSDVGLCALLRSDWMRLQGL